MNNQGFSLVWVSAIVAVMGIMVAATLPGGEAGNDLKKNAITLERMQKIEDATRAFMAANLRRPCPADGTLAKSHANFGKETATPGTCTGANFTDSIDIVAGTVPTKALGLSDEYGMDGYGRRITYVVDKNATQKATCYSLQNNKTNGALKILSASGGQPLDFTMWALMSYGNDGHGAFPADGSTLANRFDTGNTSADSIINAFASTGSMGTSSFSGTLVKRALYKSSATNSFDDTVWYQESSKNSCCVGKMCNLGFTIKFPDEVGGNTADGKMLGGYPVTHGDVNGDGVDDLIIGIATGVHSATKINDVYVLFGNKTGNWAGPKEEFALTALDGTNGFVITSAGNSDSDLDYFGGNVETGDLNNDGYNDIFIYSHAYMGVVFGGTGPISAVGSPPTYTASWPASLNVDDLDGTNGLLFKRNDVAVLDLIADPGDVLDEVANFAIGDFNCDGIDDITHAGYVVFGQSPSYDWSTIAGFDDTPLPARVDSMDTLAPPSGFRIDIADDIAGAGSKNTEWFVSAAGNINNTKIGDNYCDAIIIGGIASSNRYRNDTTNSGFAIFGRSNADWTNTYNNSSNKISLTDELAGTFNSAVGYVNNASYDPDYTNATVRATAFDIGASPYTAPLPGSYYGINAEDLNNDGIKDIIIEGLPYLNMFDPMLPEFPIYIYWGKSASSWAADTDIAAAVDGSSATNGFILDFNADSPALDYYAFPKFFDINNDGKKDILINFPLSIDGGGLAFYPSGIFALMQPAAGWPATVTVFDSDDWFYKASDPNPGTPVDTTGASGFVLNGTNIAIGYTLPIGDINKDGRNDFITIDFAYNGGGGGGYLRYGRDNIPWDPVMSTDDFIP